MIVEEEDHFPSLIEAFVWVARKSGMGGGGEGGTEWLPCSGQSTFPTRSLRGKQAFEHTEPAVLLQLALLAARLSKCKWSPLSEHIWKPNQLLSYAFRQRRLSLPKDRKVILRAGFPGSGGSIQGPTGIVILLMTIS